MLILMNHDLTEAIGRMKEEGTRIIMTFREDASVTDDMLPEGAYDVLESRAQDGVRFLKKVRYHYFSLTPNMKRSADIMAAEEEAR